MAPVTGWYPDPAGVAALRFWDGQTWTTATAAAPVVQQYAPPTPANLQAATPQATWGASPGFSRRPPAKRAKRAYGLLAGGVAAIVLVAAAVPLVLTKDHHATGPTTAAFSRVLLSSGEVGETASGTFTVAAPSADDSNDNTTSGCAALDSSDQATQTKGKAYASREYTAPSLALYAEEELAYLPGAAAPLMDALASAIKSCHTLTIDGATLAFTVVPTPTVAGSDQTFSALASGRISGRYVSIDMQMVRVGDTVLTLTYGGIDDPSAVEAVADRLLVHATAKAKGVL